MKNFTESELQNQNNWYDFGLTEYFSNQKKFQSSIDIAYEVFRLLGVDQDSDGAHLLVSAFSACHALGAKHAAKIVSVDLNNELMEKIIDLDS